MARCEWIVDVAGPHEGCAEFTPAEEWTQFRCANDGRMYTLRGFFGLEPVVLCEHHATESGVLTPH